MRNLMLVVGALAFAAGCGGDDNSGNVEPEPTTGDLVFVLDGQTCGTGSASIDMFVDGNLEDTQSFSAGTRHSVEVEAGNHIASATISNTTIIFNPVNVSVPAGGEGTYLMQCI